MADLKIFTENIEPEALDQINTLIAQPAFSDCKIRIMPDVHAGAGCVIGFTADLGDKVIPNIVGVDIGCGMLTVSLGKIDIDFEKLDATIRAVIPSGKNVHGDLVSPFLIRNARKLIKRLHCVEYLRNMDWLEHSIATLGGGNHFIEIDVDDEDNKYLVIHSGSRNLGKQVAEYYQKLAVKRLYSGKEERAEIIAKLKKEGRENEIQDALSKLAFKQSGNIPKDLCYLDGTDRRLYLHDMQICQQFAEWNRELMFARIAKGMGWGKNPPKETMFLHTVHNYIEFETNMVRKGAISAKEGEMVLIPINMRDGCILGIGKGNEDWNCSAPHGAGRLMSRRRAREIVSLDDFKQSMDGIFTTSVGEDTVDESPMVYKSMDEIVANIADTVEIVKIIKPIYNFKAGE